MQYKTTIKYLSIFFLTYVFHLGFVIITNGYLFIWGDTAFYVQNAFESKHTLNGSILYPKFIKFTSFEFSYWLVAFFQFLIGFYTIKKILQIFDIDETKVVLTILGILTVSTFNSFSFTISTDIFLSISLLLLFILNSKVNLNTKAQYLLLLIYGCTVMMHRGFWFVNSAAFVFILLLELIFYKKFKINKRKLFIIGVLVFVKLIAEPLSPHMYQQVDEKIESMNVYCRVVEKMNRNNTLYSAITHSCEIENNSLCEKSEKFKAVGGKRRSLPKVGIYPKKKSSINTCKEIFGIVISSPKLILENIIVNLDNFGFQLERISNRGSYYKEHVLKRMSVYIENDFNITKHKRISSTYPSKLLEKINRYLLYFSIIIIMSCLFIKSVDRELKFLCIYILISFLFASWFYSTFSNFMNPRYSSRLSWLFPFLAFVILFKKNLLKQLYYKLLNIEN